MFEFLMNLIWFSMGSSFLDCDRLSFVLRTVQIKSVVLFQIHSFNGMHLHYLLALLYLEAHETWKALHIWFPFLWQPLNSVCPARHPPFSLTIETRELFGPDSGIKLCMSEWGTMTAGLCKYILGYLNPVVCLCAWEETLHWALRP